MLKGKFGKYTKYAIEKHEYEKDQFGIGGGRSWEL
jgi:hypothetical protein